MTSTMRKRNLLGIFFALLALTMVFVSYAVAYQYYWTLPLAVVVAGSGLWGCWTIAHDCLHGALFRNKIVAEIVGNLVLIPTLFPYYSTKYLHLAHHRHLNNVHKDRAWRPWTVDTYLGHSAFVRAFYRLMRGWFWWMGPLFFLAFEHLRISNSFPGERRKLWISFTLTAAYGASLLSLCLYLNAPFFFLTIVLLSHCIFSGIFATLTLMQHTHGVAELDHTFALWHEKDAPGLKNPIEHTIDYTYPRFVEPFLWNGNIHIPHHLQPTVPFYKLREARRQLMIESANANFSIRAFAWKELKHIVASKHLFSKKHGQIVSFKNAIAGVCLTMLVGMSMLSVSGAARAEVPPGENSISCQHYVSPHKVSVSEAKQLAVAGRFAAVSCGAATFGFDTRQHWMMVSLPVRKQPETSGLAAALVEVGYTALDHVNFYQSDDTGQLFKVETGDMLPFKDRKIFHRTFLFETVSSTNPVFIEINTEGSVQIPVKLYDPIDLAEKTTTEFVSMGVYYGIIIAMILYNFFLFLIIRERTYLFYVLYVGSYGGFQVALNGLGFMYLWPESIVWNNFSIPVLIALMFGFMFLFAINFLQSKDNSPRFHKALVAGAVVSMIFAAIAPFIPLSVSIKGIVLYSILCSVLVLIAGIVVTVGGYRPARYFLIAWSTFLVGIVAISLKNFGLLPSGFLTDYGMQIGSALETVLLSMGLGYRIRQVEDEKAQALVSAHQVEQQAVKHKAIARTTQMLAHDVRRPFLQLKSILTTLSHQQDAASVAARAVEFLPEVDRSITSVTGMLQDILEIDRMTILSTKTHNLCSVFEDCKKIVQAEHQARDINIDNRMSNQVFIDVDKMRIDRVFCNLLANAVEATSGDDRIWVEATAKPESGMVQISIGNTGSVIPDNVKASLFEMFATSGKSQGTGIGLAISKKIVETHGGRIWCDSDVNTGTYFHFLLPMAKHPVLSEDLAASAAMDQRLITQLVVLEDCPWTVECWQNLPLKNPVRVFNNPEKFIADLAEKAISLADDTAFILDYHFEGNATVDGGQVARLLRASGFKGDIYLSSLSQIEDHAPTISDFSGRLPKDPALAARQLGFAW